MDYDSIRIKQLNNSRSISELSQETSEMSKFKACDVGLRPVSPSFLTSSICSSICMIMIFGYCLITALLATTDRNSSINFPIKDLGSSWILSIICLCIIFFICLWSFYESVNKLSDMQICDEQYIKKNKI
jgi:hypothetical protein